MDQTTISKQNCHVVSECIMNPCEEIIRKNVQEGTVSENIFADFAT